MGPRDLQWLLALRLGVQLATVWFFVWGVVVLALTALVVSLLPASVSYGDSRPGRTAAGEQAPLIRRPTTANQP